jgi:transcriptional regulator with XRE-family HTH domain
MFIYNNLLLFLLKIFYIMYEKLKTTRESKNIKQKEMAAKVAMHQSTYSNKEKGKTGISNEEWLRFAKALEVEVEVIKEEKPYNAKNINCTFNDNSVGIQYINIPKEIYETMLKYNKKLEEENEVLRKG